MLQITALACSCPVPRPGNTPADVPSGAGGTEEAGGRTASSGGLSYHRGGGEFRDFPADRTGRHASGPPGRYQAHTAVVHAVDVVPEQPELVCNTRESGERGSMDQASVDQSPARSASCMIHLCSRKGRRVSKLRPGNGGKVQAGQMAPTRDVGKANTKIAISTTRR